MNALDRIEAAFFDGDWEWLDDNVKYDTIASLVAVARAAEAVLHGEDELTRLGLADVGRYDALHHALAPLVKEADHDRA